MKRYDIAIIGGGASGLLCAALLTEYGFKDFALIERGERLGKKLSSTGNGQGNVTNVNMGADKYFSDGIEKVERILSRFDEKALVSFFEKLGGLFISDEKGRVYPASKQASAVNDLLRGYIPSENVLLSFTVKDISKKEGGYVILGESESVFAKKVIVCAGGKAQKNFGTDGNFYPVMKKLSHSVTELYPSLVQIKTDTEHIKTLKGIRADAVLTARVGKEILASSRGDVIFTEYGVSGNAAFYLSPYITDKSGVEIDIEFLPEVSKEKLLFIIENKLAVRRDIPESEILSCILNNQIGRAVVKRVKNYSAEEIVSQIKKFTLKYKGTLGFDYAQVTKGGIPLSEVTDCLESKFNRGLYICGEILNVDGECGGYNLQWAFSSAYSAVKDILKL